MLSSSRSIFKHAIVSRRDMLLNIFKQATRSGAGIVFICSDTNSILLLQRSEAVTEPGTWGVPGGSAEGMEKPIETAVREAREELGSLPQKARLVDELVNKDNQGEYYIFIMEISDNEKTNFTTNIKLNNESSQFKWFKLNKIPKNLHSAIRIIR